MILTSVQDQAMAARMALIVGSETFDRLFAGLRFGEVNGHILFAFAKDDDAAATIEDTFALPISAIASGILGREIKFVVLVPTELSSS